MFQIPDFFVDVPTFDEAWDTMTRFGRGDCLEGMNAMNRVWEEYIASDDQDDDEFFSNWCYEMNAFNVVFEGMGKLFGEVK